MWLTILMIGVIPGLTTALLYHKPIFNKWNSFLSILPVLAGCFILGKLVLGPPLFYWQPPYMIPNFIFFLAPVIGYFLGIALLKFWPFKSSVRIAPRYMNSTVTADELDLLQKRLQLLMVKDKVYTRQDISLEDLAIMLRSDRHTVSRLINERYQQNFFHFINSHRIKHFIQLVQSEGTKPGYAKLSAQVGFRSKTSFIKAFKREKQQTPSAFFQNLISS